jgi:cellulose biosynthesis protein BcsQ
MASLASRRRHPAKRLAIFNHKGGVGKTTLTLNVAAALAYMGKKVLLVDSDPQCNLTSYLLEDSIVDNLLDHSDDPQGETLWSAVKPIVEASGDVRSIAAKELSIGNLYLLPGDIRLSDFESELNQLWADCLQRKVKGFRGTAALSAAVNDVAEDLGIDFVFYDSGPNIGPLNRSILLDCDYLIIPAACDVFSVRALKTLGHTLATWIQDWQTILALAPDQVYRLPGRPKVMGFVPQRFRVYRGSAAAIQSKYLYQIERHVKSDVIAVLRRIDSALVEPPSVPLLIGEVKDYSTLVTHSQEQGVPVRDVEAGSPEQRLEAKKTFREIAKKIIQRAGGKAS